ncbi:MAG: hypothetical protein ACE5GI_00665 [Candidatus Aminicenantales bacterium]
MTRERTIGFWLGLKSNKRDKSIALFMTIIVITLTMIAYMPAIKGSFFSDDYVYVVNNDVLGHIPLFQGWKIFLRTNPYEYLPVRDLSFKIDMTLFGLQSWGYHLHNFILYALTCLVVWYCTLAIFRIF